jgi:hypothetical protein
MDKLHLKRQILEATFNRRKTQLEQCLALAILAADLRELEDAVRERRELLANTHQLGKTTLCWICDALTTLNLGDSTSSAELLLNEHKKLLPEAKQLQERALKITKATEQLVASGCFAGEQATEQSYAILSATSDYYTDLQGREGLLERIVAFFRSAKAVSIETIREFSSVKSFFPGFGQAGSTGESTGFGKTAVDFSTIDPAARPVLQSHRRHHQRSDRGRTRHFRSSRTRQSRSRGRQENSRRARKQEDLSGSTVRGPPRRKHSNKQGPQQLPRKTQRNLQLVGERGGSVPPGAPQHGRRPPHGQRLPGLAQPAT